MTQIKSFLIFLFLISLTGCAHKHWSVTSAISSKIAIDSSTDPIADSNYITSIQAFKLELDNKMNVVVGVASETMKAHGPESLLSNFASDVYRKVASDFEGKNIDIAIANLGGLRTIIPQGNITIGKIFELMPFENELVILWLKGDKLNELCQYFAGMGGEGVSGLRMTILNKEAIDITINGQPLETNKVYSIATNDYLAGGNDKMVQLAKSEKKVVTGIKIRDMFIKYIQTETANGHKISSQLDGRIK